MKKQTDIFGFLLAVGMVLAAAAAFALAPSSTVTFPVDGQTYPYNRPLNPGPNLLLIGGTATDNSGTGIKYVLVNISSSHGKTSGYASDAVGDGSWATWNYQWWPAVDNNGYRIWTQAYDNLTGVQPRGAGILVYVSQMFCGTCPTNQTMSSTGYFRQPNGIYAVPMTYYWRQDGVMKGKGKLAFSNPYTPGFKNISGLVFMQLTGVTANKRTDVMVCVLDSSGYWQQSIDTLYPEITTTNNTVWTNLDAATSSRASQASIDAGFRNTSGIIARNKGTGGSGPSAFTIATSVDYKLTARHGAGSWQTATVLPFQGSVSYETAASGRDVHVVRGDSVSIPYRIGKDLTGYTVWFGAKANPADTAYAVPLRDITPGVTDASTGVGSIDLTTADTAAPPRRYYAEVEIRKGDVVSTPLRFFLWIDADIIR